MSESTLPYDPGEYVPRKYVTFLFCAKCHTLIKGEGILSREAEAELAKKFGWTYTDGKYLCGRCQ